jgi:thiamine biosynthesis lipoprotein
MTRTVQRAYAATRWNALGSYVSLVVADGERLESARVAAAELLDRVDRTCSRFRADSDLARANAQAGRWTTVDPLLVQAVEAAVRIAGATEGLVDPTLGDHLIALGYDRDLAELTWGPGRPPVPSPPVVPDGWRRIGLDPDGALQVPADMTLDLGATGKAFAADLIAATVPRRAGTALIVSLGGDVAVGSSPDPTEPELHRWQVAVAERSEDAVRPEAEIVVLEEGGLATSSTLARRWRRGGTSMHHLIDPRTGRPAEAIWRTASVCAASCLDANAASTAAIVLGEQAPAWLWERDLAARLVGADGRVMRVAGWPEPER